MEPLIDVLIGKEETLEGKPREGIELLGLMRWFEGS